MLERKGDRVFFSMSKQRIVVLLLQNKTRSISHTRNANLHPKHKQTDRSIKEDTRKKIQNHHHSQRAMQKIVSTKKKVKNFSCSSFAHGNFTAWHFFCIQEGGTKKPQTILCGFGCWEFSSSSSSSSPKNKMINQAGKLFCLHPLGMDRLAL